MSAPASRSSNPRTRKLAITLLAGAGALALLLVVGFWLAGLGSPADTATPDPNLPGATVAGSPEGTPPDTVASYDPVGRADDEVISEEVGEIPSLIQGKAEVKVSPGTSRADLEAAGAEAGFTVTEWMPEIGWAGITADGVATLTDDVLASLVTGGLAESAEPAVVARAMYTPTDPLYSYQWGLKNTGQSGGTVGVDANVEPAQDWSRGDAVIVAVVDSGVDYTHVDLDAKMWANTDEAAGNGIDDDGNGYVDDTRGWDFVGADNNPMDDNNHGTHVAGIIGAETSNGQGIAGVAPNVKIMAIKALDAAGNGSSTALANGIYYAVNNGAKIINASWGGPSSAAYSAAVGYAETSGVLVVAAAGNGSTDGIGDNNDVYSSTQGTPNYPSSLPNGNVIAVAALTRTNTLASFSNYGATSVDIAAPGVDIASSVTPVGALEYVTSDGFESLAAWDLASLGTAGNPWALHTAATIAPYNGTYSAAVYPTIANQREHMTLKTGFSLATYTSPVMYYRYNLNTTAETGFVVRAWSDQAPTPVIKQAVYGNTYGWALASYSLAEFAGHTGVKVRFETIAGAAGAGQRVAVDSFVVLARPVLTPPQYAYMNGTSQATPHVAGVAALAWARTPGATAAQIRARILSTATPVGSLAGKMTTGGRLNAEAAVGQTAPPSGLVGTPTGSGSMALTWANDTTDAYFSATKVLARLGEPVTGSSDASATAVYEGAGVSAALTGVESGTWYLAAYSQNDFGMWSEEATASVALSSLIETPDGEYENQVVVTFPSWDATGVVTATPMTPPAPISSLLKVAEGLCFDIETSVGYTGPATVTLYYGASEEALEKEGSVRLYHYENGGWVDITTSQDMTANTVSGTASSFSPFAVVVAADTAALPVPAADPWALGLLAVGGFAVAGWTARRRTSIEG